MLSKRTRGIDAVDQYENLAPGERSPTPESVIIKGRGDARDWADAILGTTFTLLEDGRRKETFLDVRQVTAFEPSFGGVLRVVLDGGEELFVDELVKNPTAGFDAYLVRGGRRSRLKLTKILKIEKVT